jgi:hypothetical protein
VNDASFVFKIYYENERKLITLEVGSGTEVKNAKKRRRTSLHTAKFEDILQEKQINWAQDTE